MSGFPLRELNIYPIKSCRGFGLTKMTVSSSGPVGDRQWMLVDDNGLFLSQRTLPKMASIETHFDGKALTVGFNKQFFVVPFSNSTKRPVKVKIWSDNVDANLEPNLYSQAISQYLGFSCRLVRYTEESKRRTLSSQEDWKPEVRFADRKPMLLVNTKSVDFVNARLGGNPIGADRFRANLVFEGKEAFEEEAWTRIRIGTVVFSKPGKCSRCKIINLDQKSGEALTPEPLSVLAEERREGTKVNFGVLWIPENEGVISLTDSLEVLD